MTINSFRFRRRRGSYIYASGGAAAWTPQVLVDAGKVHLWLHADLGVTLTGDDVSAWADQSGNGFDAVQADPADQPLYTGVSLGGRQAVGFDGVSEFMDLTGIAVSARDYTIAASVDNTIKNANLLDSLTGRLILAAGFTPGFYYDGSWKVLVAQTAGEQSLVWDLNSAGATVYRDGSSIGTGAYTPTALGGTTALCAFRTGVGANYDGKVREFLICDTLTADERAELFAYQAAGSPV